MNKFSIIIVCLSLAYIAEAGIRCSIGGDTACSLGCKVLGQSGGTCDDDNKCWYVNSKIFFLYSRVELIGFSFFQVQ